MIIRDSNFYRTAGFNSYVLGYNAFSCPFSDKTHKQEMLLWLDGYMRAKRMGAYNCI